MTLQELINYLDTNTSHRFSTDDNKTLQHVRDGTHPDGLIGELLKAITDKCECTDESCELTRERVVLSIGPLRLKYMADDAPVEGFRLIEGTITAIDDAFNKEAINQKG